jgi:hypothetical protein
MSKKKTELANAISSLRPNIPLKLAKSQSFEAPKLENISEGRNVTEDQNPPQDQNLTPRGIAPPDLKSTDPGGEKSTHFKVFSSKDSFKVSLSKSEREIFFKLFQPHGTGKAGEEGRIHSPMVWLNGHWERNLARYETWKKQQQTLPAAKARLAVAEKALAEKAERERVKLAKLINISVLRKNKSFAI